jgi:hypothetical protein
MVIIAAISEPTATSASDHRREQHIAPKPPVGSAFKD